MWLVRCTPSGEGQLPCNVVGFTSVHFSGCCCISGATFVPLVRRSSQFFFFVHPQQFNGDLALDVLRRCCSMHAHSGFSTLFKSLCVKGRPAPSHGACLILGLGFSNVDKRLRGCHRKLSTRYRAVFSCFYSVCTSCLPRNVGGGLSRGSKTMRRLRCLFARYGGARRGVCLFVSRCSRFAGTVLSSTRDLRQCARRARGRNCLHTFFGGIGTKASSYVGHYFVAKMDPMAVSSLADKFGVNAGCSLSPRFGRVAKFARGRIHRVLACCSAGDPFGRAINRLVSVVGP